MIFSPDPIDRLERLWRGDVDPVARREDVEWLHDRNGLLLACCQAVQKKPDLLASWHQGGAGYTDTVPALFHSPLSDWHLQRAEAVILTAQAAAILNGWSGPGSDANSLIALITRALARYHHASEGQEQELLSATATQVAHTSGAPGIFADLQAIISERGLPWQVAPVWDLVRFLSGGELAKDDTVKVGVIFACEDRDTGFKGVAAYLRLSTVTDGLPGLSSHPEMAMVWCNKEFQDSLTTAWDYWEGMQDGVSSRRIRWSMERFRDEGDRWHKDGIIGPSLGAAFGVGLNSLLKSTGPRPDPNLIVTGALEKNGWLAKVGLDKKVAYLQRKTDLRLVVPDGLRKEIDSALHARIEEAGSVARALELMTGKLQPVLRYLDWIEGELSRLPHTFFPHRMDLEGVRVRVQVSRERLRRDERIAGKKTGFRHSVEGRGSSYKLKGVLSGHADLDGGAEDRQEREARPLDWTSEVRSLVHRCVIVASPGYGKSFLLRSEAIQLAREQREALHSQEIGADRAVLPVFLQLSSLALRKSKDGLEHAIVEVIAGLSSADDREAVRALLRERLGIDNPQASRKSDRLCLLLDALDQVSEHGSTERWSRAELAAEIGTFARNNPAVKILLTSRCVGYGCPPFRLSNTDREREWELLPMVQWQHQEEFVRKWFGDRREIADQFLSRLRNAPPAIKSLAQVPLRMAMICRLFDSEAPDATRLNLAKLRRCDLYRETLRGMLSGQWNDPPRRVNRKLIAPKVALLKRLAHHYTVRGQNKFVEEDLLDTIGEFLDKAKRSDPLSGYKSHTLLWELSEADGVLIKDGAGSDAPFMFQHLTFQEYLTAEYLSARAAEGSFEGWFASEIGPRLYDPAWADIQAMLGGTLRDELVLPYIKALAERSSEDYLKRPYDRACSAIGEASKEALDMDLDWIRVFSRDMAISFAILEETTSSLAAELRRRYTRSFTAIADYALRYLIDNMEDLDIEGGVIGLLGMIPGADSVRALQQELESRSSFDEASISSLINIGDIASIQVLEHILLDPSYDDAVRYKCAEALGSKKCVAAVPSLIMALADPDEDIRSCSAYSLGLIMDRSAERFLVRALDDEEPSVRSSAAEALGSIGGDEAAKELRARLRNFLRDSKIHRYEVSDMLERKPITSIVKAIGSIGDPKDVPLLVEALGTGDESLQEVAAEALGRIGSKSAILPLTSHLLSTSSVHGRSSASAALVRIGGNEALPILIDLLRSSDNEIRFIATEGLGVVGHEDAVPALIESLRDTDIEVAAAAAGSLGMIGDPSAVHALISALQDEHSRIKEVAAEALGEIGDESAVPSLISALRDEDLEVRLHATWALGMINNADSVPALITSLRHPYSKVRAVAAKGLGRTGSRDAVLSLIEISHNPDEETEVYTSAIDALNMIGDILASPIIYSRKESSAVSPYTVKSQIDWKEPLDLHSASEEISSSLWNENKSYRWKARHSKVFYY